MLLGISPDLIFCTERVEVDLLPGFRVPTLRLSGGPIFTRPCLKVRADWQAGCEPWGRGWGSCGGVGGCVHFGGGSGQPTSQFNCVQTVVKTEFKNLVYLLIDSGLGSGCFNACAQPGFLVRGFGQGFGPACSLGDMVERPSSQRCIQMSGMHISF